MTKQEQREEWLRCACDVNYFAEKYFIVEDKQQNKFVPFHFFDFQLETIEKYETYDGILTNKYRQAGITTTTCAYAAWKLNFFPNTKIAVVANNVDLAKEELFNKIVGFLEKLPEFLYTGINGKDSEKKKIYKNGSQLVAKAAGKNGLRGFSPNIVIMDEVAFFEFGDEFWTAARGSVSVGGKVIMISTPNGRGNLFFETYDKAKNKENDFCINEIKWYHDPRFNKELKFVKGGEEIVEDDKEKQKELISQGYKPTSPWYEKECRGYNGDMRKIAQELEGEFIGSGGTYVEDEYINDQERKYNSEPIGYHHHDGNLWIWKEPVEGRRYLLSSDVSMGNSDDFSSIQILDIDSREQVAEYRGKIPPDLLGDLIYEWAINYNMAHVVIDLTGGYGVITINKLMEYGYKNVYYSEINTKVVKDKLQKYIKNDTVPGIMVGSNRTFILEEFARCVRLDETIIKSARLISEMRTFIIINGRPDHSRSAHDDLLFAYAMALYVINNSLHKIGHSIEKTKAMLEAWSVVSANKPNYEQRESRLEGLLSSGNNAERDYNKSNEAFNRFFVM